MSWKGIKGFNATFWVEFCSLGGMGRWLCNTSRMRVWPKKRTRVGWGEVLSQRGSESSPRGGHCERWLLWGVGSWILLQWISGPVWSPAFSLPIPETATLRFVRELDWGEEKSFGGGGGGGAFFLAPVREEPYTFSRRTLKLPHKSVKFDTTGALHQGLFLTLSISSENLQSLLDYPRAVNISRELSDVRPTHRPTHHRDHNLHLRFHLVRRSLRRRPRRSRLSSWWRHKTTPPPP